MNRMIALILTISMLLGLCACGSSTGTAETAAPAEDATIVAATETLIPAEENSTEEAPAIPTENSDDVPVDLYFYIYNLGSDGSEAFLEQLKQANPENQYRYYNEEYYIQTITEGERKAVLAELLDVNAYFTGLLSNYPGLLISAELDDTIDNLTLCMDAEIYNENSFLIELYLLTSIHSYLETLQTYSLIPPESRDALFCVVDETGEILSQSVSGDSIDLTAPGWQKMDAQAAASLFGF